MIQQHEGRAESRLSEQAPIFIELLLSEDSGSPKIIICHSLDLSANGLRVIVEDWIPEQSIVRLCVNFPEQAIFLAGEVMWVKKSDDAYELGLAIYESEDTDVICWKQVIAEKLITNS